MLPAAGIWGSSALCPLQHLVSCVFEASHESLVISLFLWIDRPLFLSSFKFTANWVESTGSLSGSPSCPPSLPLVKILHCCDGANVLNVRVIEG
jgi:hypothetical protein